MLTDGQKEKHIGSKGSTFEKVLGLTLMLLTCPTIEIQMKNFTYRSYEDNYYRLLINAYIPSEEYGSWSLKEVYSDDDMFFDLNTENADFKQWMDNMNMAFGKKLTIIQTLRILKMIQIQASRIKKLMAIKL